jgi:flagellar hook-associated protein 1 FlgK
MTIMGAMNTAISGLAAASRGAAVVSNNLANALTEGYGRRELDLAARAGGGGGVVIVGETRFTNTVLLTDRRSADGTFARQGVAASFFEQVQTVMGEPGSGRSLDDLVTAVETGLLAASAQPQSVMRMEQVVDDLSRLTGRLAEIGGAIQTERARADAAIGDAVGRLNADLARLETLNEDIRRDVLRGGNGGALLDEREALIDRVAELVPVREMDRGNGVVALISEGGILMDGPAPRIGFDVTPVVTEFQTYDGGHLSGMTINGEPVDLDRGRHMLSGGEISGLLAVRDVEGPAAMARLDAFARDLIERVGSAGVDPTVSAGAPGLLTDAGAAFDLADETGLSRRIAVNGLVDPALGGAGWRLRDGLGATTPGDAGNTALLQRLGAALGEYGAAASIHAPEGRFTAAGLAAAIYSKLGVERVATETDMAQAAASASAISRSLEDRTVDSDAEMQRLLLIEQAYAANARVISAARQMLDRLMEI